MLCICIGIIIIGIINYMCVCILYHGMPLIPVYSSYLGFTVCAKLQRFLLFIIII